MIFVKKKIPLCNPLSISRKVVINNKAKIMDKKGSVLWNARRASKLKLQWQSIFHSMLLPQNLI